MQKHFSSRFASPLRQRISHKPLMLLAYAGICTRLFALLVIDLPEMRNALWLVPLGGAILALPAIGAGSYLLRRSQMCLHAGLRAACGKAFTRLALAAVAAIFAFEAAAMFVLLSESAAYATLQRTSPTALLIVTALAVICVAARGGDSAGGVAALGLILSPPLYGLVLLAQRGAVNFRWLAPLLGPGMRELMRGAQMCAFYFSLLPFVMLLDDGAIPTGPHTQRKARPVCLARLLLLCALTVSALCAVHSALYPDLTSLSDSRVLRIDLFLSTGKANRSVQLPLLLMWYSSLIVCAVFFLYMAGRLAALALGTDSALCPLLSGCLALFMALMGWANVNQTLRLSFYGVWPAQAFWVFALILAFVHGGKDAPL